MVCGYFTADVANLKETASNINLVQAYLVSLLFIKKNTSEREITPDSNPQYRA